MVLGIGNTKRTQIMKITIDIEPEDLKAIGFANTQESLQTIIDNVYEKAIEQNLFLKANQKLMDKLFKQKQEDM